MSADVESILTDLRALKDFPKVGRETGAIAEDGAVTVPLERLAALVAEVDRLREQCALVDPVVAAYRRDGRRFTSVLVRRLDALNKAWPR